MKKLFGLLLLVLLLVGCNGSIDNSGLKILAPEGAPSLSLMKHNYDNKDKDGYLKPDIVSGPDILMANLVKNDYDVIIAPINMGANLISQDNADYVLVGVVTWGNLYVVENKNQVDSDNFVLFGENAVPGKVYQVVADLISLDGGTSYLPSAADVQVALLSGKAQAGLLPEPLVSTTIAKGKENNQEFIVAYDVQELWGEINDVPNYPQAAVFVHKDTLANKEKEVDKLLVDLTETSKIMNDNDKDAMTKYLGEDIKYYGFANQDIVINNSAKLSVNYRSIEDVKEEVKVFLAIFNIVLK